MWNGMVKDFTNVLPAKAGAKWLFELDEAEIRPTEEV